MHTPITIFNLLTHRSLYSFFSLELLTLILWGTTLSTRIQCLQPFPYLQCYSLYSFPELFRSARFSPMGLFHHLEKQKHSFVTIFIPLWNPQTSKMILI